MAIPSFKLGTGIRFIGDCDAEITGETEFDLMDTLNAGLAVEVASELPKGLLIGCGIATVGLYGAGTVIGKKGGYLGTPLKPAALVPAGIGAWKGGSGRMNG